MIDRRLRATRPPRYWRHVGVMLMVLQSLGWSVREVWRAGQEYEVCL